MVDEVKTVETAVKADAAKVVAVPEAKVVAVESKTESWITKHPNYAAAIAVLLVVASVYALVKFV